MSVLTSLQVSVVLSYVIALAVPALDAVFPVLPSETAIIALGVATAGSTDPRIALLVVCCVMGAFLGDNLSYLLGRRFGPWAGRRSRCAADSSAIPAGASSSRPRWRARSGPSTRSSWAVSAGGRSRTGRGPGSRWRSA